MLPVASSMPSAYILVDVDGVLNAHGLQGKPRPDGWRLAVVDFQGQELPIIYRPEMGAELLALAEEFDAELVWCTTWEGHANEHISPLVGLPTDLRHVPMRIPKMTAGIGWIKAHSIRQWLDVLDTRPLVWFDDEPDCGYWLNREGLRDAKWVHCYHRQGIRPDPELNEARRFLAGELRSPIPTL